MSYFFTLELFDNKLEQILSDLDCSDLFKITLVSDVFDYDTEAQLAGEQILSQILDDDELENLGLEYNPDFFPALLALETLDDVEEAIEDLTEEIDFNIAIDGLPHNEKELEMKDFIMNSYSLVDEQFEMLLLRMNILIDPDTANNIDYNTNTTVH